MEEGFSLNTPGGITFFEWDGANIYQIQNPPGFVPQFTFTSRMLVLPTGQVLLTDHQLLTVQVYTANPNECPPNPGSVPVVKTAPGIISAGITYTISGTQFNGLSQGAAYGNDAQSATNYPLVYLVGLLSKDVVFCTTHDHSSRVSQPAT